MSLDRRFGINCTLCGSSNTQFMKEKSTQDFNNNCLQIISRLLKITDETCRKLPSFCSKCQDRINDLGGLFSQLDLIHQKICQVQAAVIEDFSGVELETEEAFSESQQNQDEVEILKAQLSLRQLISNRIKEENFKKNPLSSSKNFNLKADQDRQDITGIQENDDIGFSDDEMPSPWDIVEVQLKQGEAAPPVVQTSVANKTNIRESFVKLVRLTQEEIQRDVGRKTRRHPGNSKSKIIDTSSTTNVNLEEKPVKKNKRGRKVKMLTPFRCTLVKCKKRRMYFESKELLDEHVAKAHNGFKSDKCKQTYKYKMMLDMHMRTHEDERPCSCTECGESFTNTWSLRVHTAKHTGELAYQCSECSGSFKSVSGLIYHQQMQHKNERGYSYRSREETENELKYKCPYENCKRHIGFMSELLLRSHVARQHEGQTHPYECQECKRKFKVPSDYEKHLKTHQGEYPCYCSHCGRGFPSAFALKVHEVKHTGELIYKCKECPKAFKGHSGLRYHMRMIHTNDKRFICDYCGKRFAGNDKLKRHVACIHKTERPEICHLCGKTFPIRNYLHIHIRSTHEKHRYGMKHKNQNNELQNSSQAENHQQELLLLVSPENVSTTAPSTIATSQQF